jgi:hypothetical protein
MHKTISAAAVAAVLTLATPTLAAASGGCGHVIEGSDRGTFITTPLDATHVVTEDHATGYARHVGHYTLDGSEVINLATMEVSDGVYTITSSSGAVTGKYAGSAAVTADPNVITYHVAGPVLGGSGRFVRATGWLTFDGVANLATGQLCDRVTGWIAKRGHGPAGHRRQAMTRLGSPACQL